MIRGLQEGQVCQVTVGVLGDVCRAVEDQIQPYCDAVMFILLQNLQSTTVSRDLKPQILMAFGDIALALGDRFEKYLGHVLQVCCYLLMCMNAVSLSFYSLTCSFA